MGRTDARAALKYFTMELGEQFAMTPGTLTMPTWSVLSSDVARPLVPWGQPSLVRAQETSCWMKCSAEGMRLCSGSAPMMDGSSPTAFIRKMPVSSVQVTGDLLASVINNSYKYKPE